MYKVTSFVLTISLIAASCTNSNAPLRIEQKINANWKFKKGETEYAHLPEFDDTEWRSVNVPHDWSIEDYTPPVKTDTTPEINVVDGEWKFAKGEIKNFEKDNFSDSKWETVQLPNKWENHSNYLENEVFGCFRRIITMPDSLVGKDIIINLGSIDDADISYFNGEEIGKMGSFPPDFKSAWHAQRRYTIPGRLVKKDNLIAVKVYDAKGGGGIVSSVSDEEWSGPFYSLAEGGKSTGFTVGGTAWYRKHFRLTKNMQNKKVYVVFEGVYMNTDIWINGHHLGNHPYGYTEFLYDITGLLNIPGKENVLALEVKNQGSNSRWYSGSGIYRNVWLKAVPKTHFAEYGIKITPKNISSESANIHISSYIENANKNIKVKHEIINDKAEVVEQIESEVYVDSTNHTEIKLLKPTLWDTKNPYLYTLRSTLYIEDAPVDEVNNTFGVRKIEFVAGKGFLLNGVPTLLRGGCMHHDNGPLGAAAYERAEERRVELMKANGFNAIRTAHNPPSTAFLNACDKHGVLVIDEIFDDWIKGKRVDDYNQYFATHWQKDGTSMIKRDWNHPRIVMWSTGNESMQKESPDVVQASADIADLIKKLDDSRPVTAGVNRWQNENWDSVTANYMKPLDVAGYNYLPYNYNHDIKKYPHRLLYGSESEPNKALEYWIPVMENPNVIGDFVWAGFDYLGEVSIGWHGFSMGYPWTIAYCGDLDICGFKRPQSYYREIVWNTGKKVAMFVHCPEPTFESPNKSRWGYGDVHASWNWKGNEGKNLKVDVYSNCETVKLFLNDKLLGEKQTNIDNKHIASWNVLYTPGMLKAIGYNDNTAVDSFLLKTAGKPHGIKLTADTTNADLRFITVEIIDATGQRIPNAEIELEFELEGNGKILACGSGKPNSVESFQRNKRTTFEGRALVIVKKLSVNDKMVLRANSEKLTGKVSF